MRAPPSNTYILGMTLRWLIAGIPYAEPPVGQLRLKGPVSKLSLDGSSFDATSFGSGCIQPVRLLPCPLLLKSYSRIPIGCGRDGPL